MMFFVLLSFFGNAQLKVWNSGNVSVADLADAERPAKFFVHGPTILWGTTTFANWSSVFLDLSGPYSSPIIYPENNWYLHFGKPTKKIGDIWVSHVIADMLEVPNLFFVGSDSTIKENIKEVKNAGNILKKFKTVSYDLKESQFKLLPDSLRIKTDKDRKNRYGFIAQSVEKFAPELVHFNTDTKLYSIKYIDIIPLLVQSYQDQQISIDSLKAELKLLKSEMNSLKGNKNKSLFINTQSDTTIVLDYENQPKLYQNNPNPFNNNTDISYFLPESIKTAYLKIFTSSGIEIKSIILNKRNIQSITINANELPAGIYIYSLICDGVQLDSKQMILTK